MLRDSHDAPFPGGRCWLHLSLCALLMLNLVALADTGIYRIVKPDGTVLYTDRPGDAVERIEVVPGNRYRTPSAPTTEPPPSRREPAQPTPPTPEYQVSMVEPAAGTTVRAPGGRFSIRVSIDPAPADDLYLIAYINGEAGNSPVPAATDTDLEVFSEIPGDRQLQVALVDAEQRVLARSSTQPIYLLRRALLQPAPANPAPNWNPPGDS